MKHFLFTFLLLNLYLINGISSFESREVIEYGRRLQPFYDKVQSKEPLTADEIENATETASSYYSYLTSQGIPYGALAKDVVHNEGPFGRLANSYLISRGKTEGKSEKELENIKNNLRVALAYQDTYMRSQLPPNSDGSISYGTIANYHYASFKDQGLSKYAWGGTLFEEFAGSGSWMDLGGYDKSVDVKQADFLKAILTNKEVEGVKAFEALKAVMKNSLDNLGDTWKALFSSDSKMLTKLMEITTTSSPETTTEEEWCCYGKYRTWYNECCWSANQYTEDCRKGGEMCIVQLRQRF